MIDLSALAAYGTEDRSWDRALTIAKEVLAVPPHLARFFKVSWKGQNDFKDFIKTLSCSGLNITSLLDAADMGRDLADAASVEQAVKYLGVSASSAVLAVNLACNRVLKSSPPALWRTLFEQMITEIEVGHRVGARVLEIGMEGGILMGFVRQSGYAIMLARDPHSFTQWYGMSQRDPKARRFLIERYGCEPYQVAAFALQQLGFGPDVAIGAALGAGKLTPHHLEVPPDVERWRAAYLWIEALREGRNFPGDPEMRVFFRELAPPKDRRSKNLTLDVVYTEVGKIRRSGSRWTWHLPHAGYDQTAAALGLP